jgi:hypothetical protein
MTVSTENKGVRSNSFPFRPDNKHGLANTSRRIICQTGS